MKKHYAALFAMCALVGFGACNQNKKTTEVTTETDTLAVDSTVYQGTIPAADGPGITYELALANDTSLGFRLTRTYLEAQDGKDQTFVSNGRAERIVKEVDGDSLRFLQFNETDGSGKEIFKVLNDSVLRMVNAEYKETESKGLNYDLKKVK